MYFFFELHKSRLEKNSLNLSQGHIEEEISVLGSKMPPKKNSTPIKPSEGSTMTHEEEEVQHDISNNKSKCTKFLSHKKQQKMKWKF